MSHCDLPKEAFLKEKTKILNYYAYQHHPWDVVITAEDTQFPAHKAVLRELGPYFSTIFSRWNKHVYNIPGVSSKIMQLILQYAYSKRVMLTGSNVQELLEAADYLLVEDIVKRCCQFLTELPRNSEFGLTALPAPAEELGAPVVHSSPDKYHCSSYTQAFPPKARRE